MQDNPITDAEQRVMCAVWSEAPASARQIIEHVLEEEDWQPKTVQTLIGRLVDKKMLLREALGRRYLYRPAIEQNEFKQQKSQSFVQRIFNGRITPLVAAFAESKSLSDEDLQALRQLVDSLEPTTTIANHQNNDD